jgi:hypothetical protein
MSEQPLPERGERDPFFGREPMGTLASESVLAYDRGEQVLDEREALERAILRLDAEQNWSVEKACDGTALMYRMGVGDGWRAALAAPHDEVERESNERFAVVEMLCGKLADPECGECQGDGLDYEGSEWTVCDCVLDALATPDRKDHDG